MKKKKIYKSLLTAHIKVKKYTYLWKESWEMNVIGDTLGSSLGHYEIAL